MLELYETIEVEVLKTHLTKTLQRVTQSPIVIMNRATPKAVMVAPDEWKAIAKRLEEQQDIIDVLEAKLELATSEDSIEPFDIAELEKMAGRVPA